MEGGRKHTSDVKSWHVANHMPWESETFKDNARVMAELPVRDFPVNDIFAAGSHFNVGFIHFSSTGNVT